MSLIICDTNIFVSAFNGFEQAINELKKIGDRNVLMPSISAMELYRGMKRKREMNEMAKKNHCITLFISTRKLPNCPCR